MYRIIKCGNYVQMGFDNVEEANAYWSTFGINKNKKCTLYSCACNEDYPNIEMEYPLFALDYFSLNDNCLAFISMPRTYYEKVRHRIENCC